MNALTEHGAETLLIIGVHRAERAFGRAVAAALAPGQVDLLDIPDGLSGRHPRRDELQRYLLTHRALYGQLLAHVRPCHRLLIDLHTGQDSAGPCADLFSASAPLREALKQPTNPTVRIWPLGDEPASAARTVVPPSIWHNPSFAYVALEIYLPDPTDQETWDRGVLLAVGLIGQLRAASLVAAS